MAETSSNNHARMRLLYFVTSLPVMIRIAVGSSRHLLNQHMEHWVRMPYASSTTSSFTALVHVITSKHLPRSNSMPTTQPLTQLIDHARMHTYILLLYFLTSLLNTSFNCTTIGFHSVSVSETLNVQFKRCTQMAMSYKNQAVHLYVLWRVNLSRLRISWRKQRSDVKMEGIKKKFVVRDQSNWRQI
jgi:hypothetical protein